MSVPMPRDPSWAASLRVGGGDDRWGVGGVGVRTTEARLTRGCEEGGGVMEVDIGGGDASLDGAGPAMASGVVDLETASASTGSSEGAADAESIAQRCAVDAGREVVRMSEILWRAEMERQLAEVIAREGRWSLRRRGRHSKR